MSLPQNLHLRQQRQAFVRGFGRQRRRPDGHDELQRRGGRGRGVISGTHRGAEAPPVRRPIAGGQHGLGARLHGHHVPHLPLAAHVHRRVSRKP